MGSRGQKPNPNVIRRGRTARHEADRVAPDITSILGRGRRRRQRKTGYRMGTPSRLICEAPRCDFVAWRLLARETGPKGVIVGVAQQIEALRNALLTTVAERDVIDVIDRAVPVLRDAYRSGPGEFSEPDIAFLRQVTDCRRALGTFVDVLESLNEARDVDDLLNAKVALSSVEEACSGFAVAKRVAKEQRELNERMPAAVRIEVVNRLAARTARRTAAEAAMNRRCPDRHRMVVRDGRNGPFWGCSWYRADGSGCTATANLTDDERSQLGIA